MVSLPAPDNLPLSRIVGDYSEEIVAQVLNSLVEEGIIKGYLWTAREKREGSGVAALVALVLDENQKVDFLFQLPSDSIFPIQVKTGRRDTRERWPIISTRISIRDRGRTRKLLVPEDTLTRIRKSILDLLAQEVPVPPSYYWFFRALQQKAS